MAFIFLRKRKIMRLVSRSLPTLRKRIRALTLSERGATLAISSATLLAIGRQKAVPMASAPHRIDPLIVIETSEALVESREATLRRLDRLGDGVPAEVIAQAIRQILAFEIVMVTLSLSLDPSNAKLVKDVWKDVATGARSRRAAVETLVRFAKATGSPPLPLVEGKRWTAPQVEALVSTVPPFLRSSIQPRKAA